MFRKKAFITMVVSLTIIFGMVITGFASAQANVVPEQVNLVPEQVSSATKQVNLVEESKSTENLSVPSPVPNETYSIDLSAPSSVPGATYDEEAGVITFDSSANGNIYELTGQTTTTRVVVPDGVTTDITLNNCSIETHRSPIELQGNAIVNLHLEDGTTSTLTCTEVLPSEPNVAGIYAPIGTTINIDGMGALVATGGNGGSGIGGGYAATAGTITISGEVDLTATGGDGGAGIGGGYAAAGGTTTISDGTNVTATGGTGGAGIGGGLFGAGGSIIISDDATVVAGGGTEGAGIGGGSDGASGNISISETANVTAVSDGIKPALDDVNGENGAEVPANLVNATLETPISTTADSTVKIFDEEGVTPLASDITLPANYKSFATTTGTYKGNLTIEAKNPQGASVGYIVKLDDSKASSGTTLDNTAVKLIDMHNITIDLSGTVVDQPGYTVTDNVITFNPSAVHYNYTVVGTSENQYRFVIPNGVGSTEKPLNITLSNATITNEQSPVELQGNANVNLHLAEGTTNTLTCTGYGSLSNPIVAGILVTTNTTLTIDGTGSLTAIGGTYGAGIGGGYGVAGIEGGTIVINDGNITSSGGARAAGIGGGAFYSGGTITINGGNVIATSPGGVFGEGAGIGAGGWNGAPADVSISSNANVLATCDGTNPAIDDVDGVNDSDTPANVVVATLDTLPSNGVYRVTDSSGNPIMLANGTNEIAMNEASISFAFTTGDYTGEVNIDAYAADGTTLLGPVIEIDDNSNPDTSKGFTNELVYLNDEPVME